MISAALQSGFLIHASYKDYLDEKQCLSVYRFSREIVGSSETLKIFREVDTTRLDATALGFAEGDTFQFVRAPQKISLIRDAYDEPPTTWPTTACQAIHQLYDTLGDRQTGATAVVSDPVFCGPLSVHP